MSTEIVIKAKDYGLDEKQEENITSALKLPLSERDLLSKEFEKVSKLEILEENLPAFKELRLKVQKNRTQGIEKWHKDNKAYFLTGGRFVDAIRNKEVAVNIAMEEYLMRGEKHFERLEKDRIAKIQAERTAELNKYIEVPQQIELGTMADDVWELYLSAKKADFKIREKAKKEAEEERIKKEAEAAAEKERVRLENIKLKEEAEALRIEAEKKAALTKVRQEELAPYIIYIRNYAEMLEMSPAAYKKELADIKTAQKLQMEADAKEAAAKAKKDKEEAEIKAKAQADRIALEAKLKAAEAVVKKTTTVESLVIPGFPPPETKVKTDIVEHLIKDLGDLQETYAGLFKGHPKEPLFENVSELISKTITYINNKK